MHLYRGSVSPRTLLPIFANKQANSKEIPDTDQHGNAVNVPDVADTALGKGVSAGAVFRVWTNSHPGSESWSCVSSSPFEFGCCCPPGSLKPLLEMLQSLQSISSE